MKVRKLLTAAAMGLAMAGSALAAGNASHDHGHGHGGGAETLQLNAGKKWETDAPLRQAMGNIRRTVAALHHDIHENRLSKKNYASLAQKVETEVGSIVANCKLDPQADKQLHLVVADLLEGAELMAGKAKAGSRRDGAVRVIGALDKYGEYFDDPGFKPIRH